MNPDFARPVLVSLFLVFVLAPLTYAQQNRSPAKEEFEAGLLSYNLGNYPEAREHFEAALRLKPSNRTIPLWIARAIHRQYQSGVKTSENWAIGMEAVAAYDRVPPGATFSEALNASLQLLIDMGDEELADRWRLRIASAFQVPAKERVTAFESMAARMLECARTIDVAVGPGEAMALAHVGAAQLCITNGLEYTEKALALDPNDSVAREQQSNLQLEKQRLEKMVADPVTPTKRVASVEWRRAEGAIAARDAAAPGEDAADLRRIAVEKGVNIKGLAIRKPLPVYPPEAREARVSGVVTVNVSADETGKVFYASVLSGHYLLRQAALTAAQGAEFEPVYFDGQAIRISHTITYYFLLNDSR